MAAVCRNREGFTLIEVLVSLVILMVVMMGILAALITALEQNMKNQLRNEGVSVADAEMRRELAKGFNNVSTTTSTWVRTRRVMTALKNYSVARTGNTVSNTKTVTYTVSWHYKKAQYNHSISSATTSTTSQ